MSKSVTFLKGRDDGDWTGYLAARCAALDAERIVIDRIQPTPAGLPYRPPSASGVVADYDVIVSLAGAPALVETIDWATLLGEAPVAAHGYAVEERSIFDRGAPRGIGLSPGTKLFGLLMFHADMPDSAVQRSWALHAELAERVHVGASRYVQNWITRRLSPDAPDARGMPEMSFPTHSDLIDRFFDSSRGRDEILQDTAHFVAHGPRFYCVEHIVRC